MMFSGQSCIIPMGNKTESGICEEIYNCPYANALTNKEQRKPKMCWFNDDIRIVCCPLKDKLHTLGLFGKMYESSSEGVKRSTNTICRYDGTLQKCCPAPRAAPPPSEHGCPSLDTPEAPPDFTIAQRIAWNKCMEYQRYVEPCVAGKSPYTGRVDKHRLIRVKRCFIERPQNRYRISGGEDANYKEFPHMAVLGHYNYTAFTVEWGAGGSLINEQFILTAAHVLYDPSRPLRYALLGTLNNTDFRNGSLYSVVRTVPHPLYDFYKQKNDIALLQLDRPVLMSEFIRPICLFVPSFRTEDGQRTVAGWGATGKSPGMSQMLQMTDNLYITDHTECLKLKSNSKFNFTSKFHICAKSPALNKSDSCQGDSGGPLMILNSTFCSYVVEGVVSFGAGNCALGAAAVYTRVDGYLDWLVRNVWPDDWNTAKGQPVMYI
ncbi:phenoloxidase-activating factor 3 [Bicyclus anynana]|uniref:Phenoloxidase-activating factor 3 n=1 Tax=Bicyclus anynana TaxID=110368 RepID=A0ABM3M1U2_BICAN|nr:phenoloxidase-activating factor 3 [Bicyclus anynana]